MCVSVPVCEYVCECKHVCCFYFSIYLIFSLSPLSSSLSSDGGIHGPNNFALTGGSLLLLPRNGWYSYPLTLSLTLSPSPSYSSCHPNSILITHSHSHTHTYILTYSLPHSLSHTQECPQEILVNVSGRPQAFWVSETTFFAKDKWAEIGNITFGEGDVIFFHSNGLSGMCV